MPPAEMACNKKLQNEISEEKIKDSKNGRLYKSMGALIGMLIVVALV